MSQSLSIKQEVELKLQNLLPPEVVSTDSDVQINYRKAAAVLDYFDFSEINPVGGENNMKEALDSLLPVSRVVFDQNHKPQRTLTDGVRRETLQTILSENSLTAVLEANPERPQTEFQKILESYLLHKSAPPLDRLNQRELLASCQVAAILSGLVEGIPTAEQVRRQMAITDLLNPFRFLLGITADNPHGIFYGREAEMNRLSDYVGFQQASSSFEVIRRNLHKSLGFRQKPPLFIYAPGGMGKSTLLAKFILDHAKFDGDEKIAFVYLDFDRAGLSLGEPVTLLIEAIQQLIVQFPENQVSLTELREKWLNRLSSEDGTNLKETTTNRRVFRVKNHYTYIYQFAEVVKDFAIDDKPLLFVLDTFEEVQYRSRVYVEEILTFFNELLEQLPTLRIVLSGRAENSAEKFKVDPFPLPQFDAKAAEGYLIKQGVDDTKTAQSIVKQFGGCPLTLKLTAELYKMGEANAEGIPDVKTTEWFFRAEEEVIQGQLYNRIFSRIRDDKIKQLVHPGLVLRRITPELIFSVLAAPCGINVPDMNEARSLFDKLKQQITLVIPYNNDVLVHRPDVRRVMLSLMKKSKPHVVEEIHRAAVQYYQQFEDETSRAEEIYHRLSLEFNREELNACWIEGLQFSRDAIEELPVQAQIFLASRIGIELSPEVWKSAEAEDWILHARKSAVELISVGRFDEALRLIDEALQLATEWRDKSTNLFLLILKIDVLQQMENYQEALEIARRGLEIASRGGGESFVNEFSKRIEMIETYIQPHKW